MSAKNNSKSCDIVKGMKAITQLVGASESTVLKWHRELDLPIKKGSKNGDSGIWIGSRKKIDEWVQEYVE